MPIFGAVLAGLALACAAAAGAPSTRPASADPALVALLRDGDLNALDAACVSAVRRRDGLMLHQLQQRLLTIHPAPQPFLVVMANAHSMLSCQAPDGALRVLDRVGPAQGYEREQWLVLQWRAAHAGLHHQLAADALTRLAAGNLHQLELLELPVGQRQDGSSINRPALDLLADHFESLGKRDRAAEVLAGSSQNGAATAARLARAVALFGALPALEQDRLLELALEQAASSGSWGLVAEILDQQLALPGITPDQVARSAERRLRLSARIDDAYGEWLLQQRDPDALSWQGDLERQLRTPRDPGGHAAALQSPDPQP
ncbi:MAG: hypothetical protein O2787_05515 [Cyanobacteria bacterium]|nr:hypothetical protein [Cyanobacteriota bacterium]